MGAPARTGRRAPYRSLYLLGVALTGGLALAADIDDTPSPHARSVSDRILHTFDFDERPLGNTEEVPMYWVPIRRPDFPHYASGVFDPNVGHVAPPSFHLSSEGRSVAFIYSGPATRVRVNNEYRIEGFIRPDELQHARACLSAHWIDKKGEILAGSLVRSRFVGGPDDGTDWFGVELLLPAAPPEAYTIGVVAWVLQEAQWNPDAPGPRRILHADVRAGAWFDDVRIFRMPRVELHSTSRANFLHPESRQGLRVLLADPEDSSLHGALEITDVEDRVVAVHPVRVLFDTDAEPLAISVQEFPPGIYHANFEVLAGSVTISRRMLSFAVLSPLVDGTETAARSFGISLDAASGRDPPAETVLLKEQLVRSAKIPIWTGHSEGEASPDQRRAFEKMLRELTNAGFSLTGVLAAAPPELVRKRGSNTATLLELLNADPALWDETMTRLAARYADVFQWWQPGADEEPLTRWDDKARSACDALRGSLRRVVTFLQLSVPLLADAVIQPDESAADGFSFNPSTQFHATEIERRLTDLKNQSKKRTVAFVAPLGVQYDRLPRLADWARRLIRARHAAVDTVFVPQTWSVRATPRGPQTEPDETAILFRTMVDLLRDAVPGPQLAVAPGVECLTFRSGDVSTLALWDLDAPVGGRDHALQLGPAAKQFDLWGNRQDVPRNDHGQGLVHLSEVPVLVQNVPSWLVDLQTAFTLSPGRIDAGRGSAELVLEARYAGTRPIVGRATLSVPDGWELFPREFDIHVLPNRTTQFPLSAHFPSGEPAGTKSIRLSLKLADDRYELEVPLATEIAIDDLDVSATALAQGDKLVLRHMVTNRSGQTLSFRAAAAVPGRERQHRPFTDLQPGDTQSVEYRFANGRELVGRRVRLLLNETNDGPRTHVLELVVP